MTWPVTLYGYEIWSLTLREGHELRISVKRMARRIFGSPYDVLGDLRILHNEKLHNLLSSQNIIRMVKRGKMKWSGCVMEHVWGRWGMHNTLWSTNLKGRDHVEFLDVRWEDKLKIDVQEIWCKDMNWIYLAQGRDQWRTAVNTAVYLQVL
jgi:hypothetical protein